MTPWGALITVVIVSGLIWAALGLLLAPLLGGQ